MDDEHNKPSKSILKEIPKYELWENIPNISTYTSSFNKKDA